MTGPVKVAQSALKLCFFLSSLTIATLGARLAAADSSPDAPSRALGVALAHKMGGDLSDASLRAFMTPDEALLFARHDPEARPTPGATLLSEFEKGPPARDLGLSPDAARAVNDGVAVDGGANPPARPFVFRGSGVDRARAVECLTDAVYYEAGFEPLEGAQAVAQVVLNRVRHPIFPKTVCGVVFQGADLKTGCQFSFTCDGSMNRPPAAAAWSRARLVAERALSGFVQKDVGEATHYHTEWVYPWWAPTVSKVAKVGVQIFYRWPGALGSPGAFTGRYAGGEPDRSMTVAARSAPVGTPDPSPPSEPSDGRVHVVLALAAAPIETPPAQVEAAKPAATLEVAALKTEAPDLKTRAARPLTPMAQATPFSCSAGPCQHW